jgi:hypothetical protein
MRDALLPRLVRRLNDNHGASFSGEAGAGLVTGHWRAINPGVTGCMTVTSGTSGSQVRAVRGPDLSDSQADSAGSIPVTRSRYGRSIWLNKSCHRRLPQE